MLTATTRGLNASTGAQYRRYHTRGKKFEYRRSTCKRQYFRYVYTYTYTYTYSYTYEWAH